MRMLQPAASPIGLLADEWNGTSHSGDPLKWTDGHPLGAVEGVGLEAWRRMEGGVSNASRSREGGTPPHWYDQMKWTHHPLALVHQLKSMWMVSSWRNSSREIH